MKPVNRRDALKDLALLGAATLATPLTTGAAADLPDNPITRENAKPGTRD